MPIVAVVNQKGGVGKTTVALGLAASASHRGLRVLVVDLDPQANATSGLGVWDAPTTVDAVLASDDPGSAARLAVASAWPMDHGAAPGAVAPSVVASTPALAAREPQLANDPIGAQDRLQIALEGHGYDLVVIDCPPSLGLLTINGLFAADRALIVTEPGAWASDGVAQIQRTITRIAARPAIAGIAVNRLGRTRDAKYWHGQLVDDYGDQVMAPVHLRAAVAEASAQSLPIHALGARAGAADRGARRHRGRGPDLGRRPRAGRRRTVRTPCRDRPDRHGRPRCRRTTRNVPDTARRPLTTTSRRRSTRCWSRTRSSPPSPRASSSRSPMAVAR